MSLRGALFAIVWAAILAFAVITTLGASTPRDSHRAQWLAGAAGGFTTVVAADDSGTVARERGDLLASAFVATGRSRADARHLALGVHVAVALSAFFVLVRESGASPGWAAAATAGGAALLQALARFGHAPWLLLGAFLPLLVGLRALVREPSGARWLACVLWIALVWVTSVIWFQATAIALLGLAFTAASRSSRHAWAIGTLVLVVGCLALGGSALAPATPAAEKLLGAVPFGFTGRRLVGSLGAADWALLTPLGAAAISSLLLERERRMPIVLAAVLAWASLGPHTPAIPGLGRPPPLRIHEWLPGAAETFLPILFAAAALAVVVGAGARFLSALTPPVLGFVAAILAAIVPLSALSEAAIGGTPGNPTAMAEAGARVVVWPLSFETQERVLEAPGSGEQVANLEPEVLVRMAELLPERPNLLWTRRFHEAMTASGTSLLRLEAEPGPLPEFLPPVEGEPRRLRLDLERLAERESRLENLERAGWRATSSARADPAGAAAAFDGRLDTRWGSGEAQSSGQFFEIDLGAPTAGITRVVLDVGIFESDRPRALRVALSDDGVAWREVALEPRPPLGQTRLEVDFPPEAARRIRLTQLGRDRVLDWSIAEIEVWRDPGA